MIHPIGSKENEFFLTVKSFSLNLLGDKVCSEILLIIVLSTPSTKSCSKLNMLLNCNRKNVFSPKWPMALESHKLR